MSEDLNAGIIGVAAAQMMQKLEEEYPDGVKVMDAMVTVEIEVPLPDDDLEQGDPDEGATIEIYDYYSTSPRRSVQLGIVDCIGTMIRDDYKNILAITENDDEDDDEG